MFSLFWRNIVAFAAPFPTLLVPTLKNQGVHELVTGCDLLLGFCTCL